MKRAIILFALVLAGTAALAQTATTRAIFVAVDAVRTDGSADLYVTGVLDGASASAEFRFRKPYTTSGPDLAECRRYALLAMSKPGQYRPSFGVSGTPQPGVAVYLYDCKLERVAP